MEVSPGSLDFDKFAIQVSEASAEESLTSPLSRHWKQGRVHKTLKLQASTVDGTGEGQLLVTADQERIPEKFGEKAEADNIHLCMEAFASRERHETRTPKRR